MSDDDDDDDDGIESLACLYVYVYNWITTFAPVFRCHSHLNLSFHRDHKPDYMVMRAGMESVGDENLVSRIRLLLVEQE